MMNDDKGDAALVDSYFLPGGLLNQIQIQSDNDNDDDDVDDRNQPLLRYHAPESAAVINKPYLSPIPSNPWEINPTTAVTQTTNSTAIGRQFMAATCPVIKKERIHHSIHSPLSLLNNKVKNDKLNKCIDHQHQHHYRQGEITVGEGIDNSLFYHKQEVNSRYDDNNNNIMEKKILRPPPGFQANPQQANGNQIASNLIGLSPSNNRSTFTERGVCDISLTNMHDPTVKLLMRYQEPIKKTEMRTVESAISIKNVPRRNKDKIRAFRNDFRHIKSHSNHRNDVSFEATPYHDGLATYDAPEELMSPITNGTKASSLLCKSIDYEDNYEDNYDDDEDEVYDEEGKDMIENSIPITICGSSNAGSNTSSLSTSSDVDNSSFSSHVSNHSYHNEGVGYDTDQAHVSQIVDVMGSSSDGEKIACDDGQVISLTSSIDISFVGQQQRTCISVCSSDQPNIVHYSWQKLTDVLRSILQYLSRITCNGINLTSSRIQRSLFFLTIRKGYQIFSQQIRNLSIKFRKITNWVKDVEEVFAVLTIQFLKITYKIVETTTKFLMIAASIILQMWKHSLLEALEEFNVTICYLVFYFMPIVCSLLMDWINLPHWTPHMITLMAVFSLCRQVKTGTLYRNDDSIFNLLGKLFISESYSITKRITQQNSNNNQHDNQEQQQGQEHEKDYVTRPRNEKICRNILKVLKFVLPILFLADGFSSESGTIIGVSGSSRLTTAYMMSLIRKNILCSPLGVLSWSLQVLIATYYHSWTFLDHVILVIGLSSIRLIRYLDAQPVVQRKRIRHGK